MGSQSTDAEISTPWDSVQVDLPNPSHISQKFHGTSEEMLPATLAEQAEPGSGVEQKLAKYAMKKFNRTVSEGEGNQKPEAFRTKRALVMCMRTLQELLRQVP